MNRFITDQKGNIVTLTSNAPKNALIKFIGKNNLKSIEEYGLRYKAVTKTGEIYYIGRK